MDLLAYLTPVLVVAVLLGSLVLLSVVISMELGVEINQAIGFVNGESEL